MEIVNALSPLAVGLFLCGGATWFATAQRAYVHRTLMAVSEDGRAEYERRLSSGLKWPWWRWPAPTERTVIAISWLVWLAVMAVGATALARGLTLLLS